MNTTLEDRLRQHYDERTSDIPDHGPGLDAGVVVRLRQPAPRSRRAGIRLAIVAGSIAAAIVLAFLVLDRPASQRTSTLSGETDPTEATHTPATALAPVQTLPDSGDRSRTPVTVDGTAPSNWYRLAPDLDIAWYQDTASEHEPTVCWRTPAGSDCRPDDTPGGAPFTVPTAGGQTLVIMSVVAGTPNGTTIDVQLSNGDVLTAPLEVDAESSFGVARFALADGESISSVGTATNLADESAAVPGATLPPAIGLSDTPITIAAGSELSYWRWFPDLDISEREVTAGAGGTELCWRTPVGTGCIDDTFESPNVGIIPTDGGAILLARPALIPIVPPPTDSLSPTMTIGPAPTTIVAALSDGTTVTAPIAYGEHFGVGYARVSLPAGVTVVGATSSS